MRRVVCFGGGTGQAQLLEGLSTLGVSAVGVTGVTDNGGHTGELRRTFALPAMGDLRSCMAVLCPPGSVWGEVLSHRFRKGPLDGVSLGNLVMAALAARRHSLSRAAADLGRAAGLRAEILPVSDGSSEVCAELEGGRVVRGEWEIILRKPRKLVRAVFHDPPLKVLPSVLERLRAADLIVFAPGCLLTGLLSTLSVGGLLPALKRSKAPKVFVVNLMTQPGQTDGLGASGHVEMLERLGGLRPDFVIVNDGRPSPALLRRYAQEGARMVVDDLADRPGIGVVRGNFLERAGAERRSTYDRGGGAWRSSPHFIRHDPRALAAAVLRLPSSGVLHAGTRKVPGRGQARPASLKG